MIMHDMNQPTHASSDGDDTSHTEADAAADTQAGTIRETTYKRPGTREQEPATEAVQADLRDVSATTVLMDRSGAEGISAERVNMERSGAKSIETRSAQLDRSGAVTMNSDHTVLLNSSAVQIVAEEARISKSSAVIITADNATIESSRILIFAGNAEGDVRPVVDIRGAAVLVAAFGCILALVLIVAGGRSRQSRRSRLPGADLGNIAQSTLRERFGRG